MNEQEWQDCSDIQTMLDFIRGQASERKRRLLACECSSRIGELLTAVGVPKGGETCYFFFMLTGDGMARYYPFKFKRPAP